MFLSQASAAVYPYSMGRDRQAVQADNYTQLRFNGVVRQQRDYSCGAAALATLLTYHLGSATTEDQLLELAHTNFPDQQQQIEQQGLSMLQLKQLAQTLGYRAAGLKLQAAQLDRLKQPVVIFYQPRQLPHFAVLTRIDERHVYLADPIRGKLRVKKSLFNGVWNNRLLVVEKKD